MNKSVRYLLLITLVFTMLLSGCSGETSEESSSETAPQTSQEAAVEATEAVSENSAPQPTAAPVDASGSGSLQASPVPLDSSRLVSDLGFRPETNGFSFQNYGSETSVQNLTPAEVQRMFGDQACASKKDGVCILTPPGQQFMEQINNAMSGGHCEGMAALSLLMYAGFVKPATFGQSEADKLNLNNADLQREIAYWWTTQAVDPHFLRNHLWHTNRNPGHFERDDKRR